MSSEILQDTRLLYKSMFVAFLNTNNELQEIGKIALEGIETNRNL